MATAGTLWVVISADGENEQLLTVIKQSNFSNGDYDGFASTRSLIAAKITADTGVTVAIIGLIGVLLGAVIGVCGTLLLHWLQSAPKRALDKQRASLLTAMLNDNRFPRHWRKISTLSRVVGASEETTKRLLIGLGARGSQNDDELWSLIKHHPISETEE